MRSINTVVLTGNLCKDLEIKYITDSFVIGLSSIAVNKAVKKGDDWTEETSFFDIRIKGNMANGLNPYLTKGSKITLIGELSQDRWEKDGQKFSRVVIDVNQVVFGSSKNETKPAPAATTPTSDGFPEDIAF